MAVRLFEAKDHLDCPRIKRSRERIECKESECERSVWSFNGEDFIGCPVKTITADSIDMLRAYQFYTDKIMPRDGGFLDQGGRYIEAMEIIDREVQDIAQAKEIEQRKKMEGNHGR